MSRYHVNPNTGEASPCRARVRPCPHGGDSGTENHYESMEEAQKAGETMLSEQHGAVNSKRTRNLSPQEALMEDSSTKLAELNNSRQATLREMDQLSQQVELMRERSKDGPTEARRQFAAKEAELLNQRLQQVSEKNEAISDEYDAANRRLTDQFSTYASTSGPEKAYRKLNSGELEYVDSMSVNSELVERSTELKRGKYVKQSMDAASNSAKSALNGLREKGFDDVSPGEDTYVHSMKYSKDRTTVKMDMVGNEDSDNTGEAYLELTAQPDGSFKGYGETSFPNMSDDGDTYEAMESVGHFDGVGEAPNALATSFMNTEGGTSQELSYWARSQSPTLSEGQRQAVKIRHQHSEATLAVRDENGDYGLYDHKGDPVGRIQRSSDEARALSAVNRPEFSDLRPANGQEGTLDLQLLSGERP